MSTSFEAVAALVMVLPGFLATVVLRALQTRRDSSAFTQFMEALAFSFAIQAVLSWVGSGQPVEVEYLGGRIDGVSVKAGAAFLAFALALVLACLVSVLAEHDCVMRFARLAKVTVKTSKPSTWLDVFGAADEYVIVHFKTGERAVGWPYQYSDSASEGLLHLTEPAWVDADGSYVDMNAESLLVFKEDLQCITFVKAEKQGDANA